MPGRDARRDNACSREPRTALKQSSTIDLQIEEVAAVTIEPNESRVESGSGNKRQMTAVNGSVCMSIEDEPPMQSAENSKKQQQAQGRRVTQKSAGKDRRFDHHRVNSERKCSPSRSGLYEDVEKRNGSRRNDLASASNKSEVQMLFARTAVAHLLTTHSSTVSFPLSTRPNSQFINSQLSSFLELVAG